MTTAVFTGGLACQVPRDPPESLPLVIPMHQYKRLPSAISCRRLEGFFFIQTLMGCQNSCAILYCNVESAADDEGTEINLMRLLM